jgi:hypothetical protein
MLSSAGLAGLSFATPEKNAMVLDEVRKVVGSGPLLGASLGILVLFVERKISA